MVGRQEGSTIKSTTSAAGVKILYIQHPTIIPPNQKKLKDEEKKEKNLNT